MGNKKQQSMLALAKKQVSKAGLILKVMNRRAPHGADIELSLLSERQGKTIRLNVATGAKDFEFKCIDACKTNRQVILQLKEDARTITKKVTQSFSNTRKRKADKFHFPTALPEGTAYGIQYLGSPVRSETYDTDWNHTVSMTASVPASDVCLLAGYDEKHMFISMLPEPVTTVDMAHHILTPKAVQKAMLAEREVLRNGEYFLVEVNEKEQKYIENVMKSDLLSKSVCKLSEDSFYIDGERSESDHFPLLHIPSSNGQTTYATGCFGSRRHFTVLNGWYRVYRNTEIENLNATSWD